MPEMGGAQREMTALERMANKANLGGDIGGGPANLTPMPSPDAPISARLAHVTMEFNTYRMESERAFAELLKRLEHLERTVG